MPRKPAVLFVCLGNICRSPLAEAAFRAEVVRMGLDVEVDSAGTGDWHVGKPPDRRAQAVAKRYVAQLAGVSPQTVAVRKDDLRPNLCAAQSLVPRLNGPSTTPVVVSA